MNNLKITLSILLCFFGISIYSQTFQGLYIFKINSTVPSQTYNNLISSQNKTWFIQTKFESLSGIPEVQKIKGENGVTVENVSDNYKNVIPAKPMEYYKDEQSNVLLSRNFYMTKDCYIKENLDQFEWKISDETIVYNDRKCNIAKTNFRGKEWTVYFDKTIPFNVAPWKFYGLPGVILFAKTSDNTYSFELKEYAIKQENTDISNPFPKEEFITWDIYTKEYKEYFKKLIKKWSADDEDGNRNTIKVDNTIEDLGFKEIN